MCGIYGIVNFDRSHVIDPSLVKAMSARMVHRGPDDKGFVLHNSSAAIGMQRLSIIDLAGGHQPISNEDGSVWVVCNGEIYNYRELRADMEARGHVFKTRSDTEVLVHLYEEYDDHMVEKLRGMYGFAILDRPRRRLLIGRDRLGIKPLYYYHDACRLIFASEIKSIITDPTVPCDLDLGGLDQYLSLGYVPAPKTMFRSIYKLLPGHTLTVQDGTARIKQYWEVPLDQDGERTDAEWAEALREALKEAVNSHLISDVPLGAFLSGGLDSSSVVCMMSQLSNKPIQTFSVGFGDENQFYNELPYARTVAKFYQTDHYEILVKPDVFDLLPKLIWHLDEPVADSAFITTYLVSEFARRTVTVILSGVGGDELFGGYRRYLGTGFSRYYNTLPVFLKDVVLPEIAKRLPVDRNSRLKNSFRLARAFINSSRLLPEASYIRFLSVFSPEAKQSLYHDDSRAALAKGGDYFPFESYLALARNTNPEAVMMFLDLKSQLPDDLLQLTDKMSMASSLECRVPFLDHKLVEFAARIPTRLKINGLKLKYILKKAMGPLLPGKVLRRGKRGFGAPVGSWLRKDLKPLAREILSEDSVKRRGYFRWHAVKRTIHLHETQQEDHTDHLLALIVFELWCRIFLDGSGRGTYHTSPQIPLR